jgi:hypothetical protein
MEDREKAAWTISVLAVIAAVVFALKPAKIEKVDRVIEVPKEVVRMVEVPKEVIKTITKEVKVPAPGDARLRDEFERLKAELSKPVLTEAPATFVAPATLAARAQADYDAAKQRYPEIASALRDQYDSYFKKNATWLGQINVDHPEVNISEIALKVSTYDDVRKMCIALIDDVKRAEGRAIAAKRDAAALERDLANTQDSASRAYVNAADARARERDAQTQAAIAQRQTADAQAQAAVAQAAAQAAPEACERCKGTGNGSLVCYGCDGKKIVFGATCVTCKGRGFSVCRYCKGTGTK